VYINHRTYRLKLQYEQVRTVERMLRSTGATVAFIPLVIGTKAISTEWRRTNYIERESILIPLAFSLYRTKADGLMAHLFFRIDRVSSRQQTH
jgi:hypothetical protein